MSEKIKNGVTELVFILDRSGSMAGLESDTIGGFNAMIEKQKKQDGENHNIVAPLLRIMARKTPPDGSRRRKNISGVAGYRGRGLVLPAVRGHRRPDPAWRTASEWNYRHS